MSTRAASPIKTAPSPSFTPVHAGLLQRKCACGTHTTGGECAECGKKKLSLQRKTRNPELESRNEDGVPPIVHDVLRSPGQPLDAATRAFFEPRFGHDFSQVRVQSAASPMIQTKLAVSRPGDVYEQEADRIADQVMAESGNPAVRGAPPRIQRFSGQSNGLDAAPASVDQALASPGRPLEPALRQDMEQRFGHDFSRVRVHSGAATEQSAQNVNAHAYTVGQDIVFGTGRFAPGTHEGRRLIAHELTHVAQQSGAAGIRVDQSGEKRGLSLIPPQEADVTLKTMPPPTLIQAQKTTEYSGSAGASRAVSPSRQNLHPILQLQTSIGNRQVQRLLTRVAGAPVMLQRKIDPAACLAQTDEILPSIGMVATIDRELTLTDTLGSEYGPLKEKIRANTVARKFVCEAGVPAVLALWDTRTVADALDVPAARTALGAATAKIYSADLDTSWLRRRRIVRAQNELSAVVSWVKSEETNTQLPQLLLPSLAAPQRENVTGAAKELDALIPVFESATKEFSAAAKDAFDLGKQLDKAKSEAIKAKNPDYMGGPREALEEADKTAKKLQQELEAVHRGINVGDLVKTSVDVAVAVAKLHRSPTTADSDTIQEVLKVVNTFRKKVSDGSTQVTDLASAARRVSFVLRYFAALNTPGFTNAPGKDEVKAMRGHLDFLSSDLELLFGSSAKLSLDFFDELAKQINRQLDQRSAMETALGHETALVPHQTDVLDFFRTLEKKSNDEVTDAYTAYAQAFFQHRSVVRLEDFDVRGLEEIFARPLSLAGARPLVCTGYAVLGANLLIAAGAKTQEFIVAVRASAEQLRTHRLDDGHAVAVMKRKGATLYVSNDLVVHNENDAIGPDAVAWTHEEFPLINVKGTTVQAATVALRAKLARP